MVHTTAPSISDPSQLLSVRTVADPRPGRVLVEVVGEVDTYTAPALELCLHSQATQPGVRELVVDLEQVRFLGAAGVRVLAQTHERCRIRGGRLVIHVGGRRAVLRSLQLTGLDQFVTVDRVRSDGTQSGGVKGGRSGARCRCRYSAMTRRRGRVPQPGPRGLA